MFLNFFNKDLQCVFGLGPVHVESGGLGQETLCKDDDIIVDDEKLFLSFLVIKCI